MVTKKQHYYPRSLLKHFADSTSKFYVYNCVANIEQYVHYESICYKKYTYEEKISDDRIIVDNILENKLSRFEGEISEIVEHIVSSRKPCILNQSEIETIWKYMFLQEIRTDSGRVRLVSNFINHFSESREFPIELTEIKNNLENINIFNKVMKKDKNLESFLSFFKKPKQMNFHISIGNGFLTSDNPVVSTFGPPNIPNGFQILMPISP